MTPPLNHPDRIGQVDTTVYRCDCGATFHALSRIVRDSRNPALPTAIDLTFTEGRAFRREHTDHGTITRDDTETR
ncbi:hypothetical protein [Prescottella subtropica]|uniref:hypothetical protein n=1 Tax=Prescottella subtropica TaxID=2545757 RepID=UPI0010F59DBF|nr:hypothetical protein [Prescottella subtropica]